MLTYFLHTERRKNRLGLIRLSDILLGEWIWEHIISFLNVLKYDFGDVDEAMIHVVERSCKINFCILLVEKSVLDEVL
jgi:hypothetical protein